MEHSVEITEASYADADKIVSLLARHKMELGNKSPEEFRHIWEANPALNDSGRRWPMGWVLRKNEREIVGFLGNIPVAYQLDGRRYIAACMSSWVVEPACREYSAQLIFRYLKQGSADILLNPNTSNMVSRKFFTAFKAREVFKGGYDRVFYWITDYRQFAASALKKRRIPFRGFLALLLSSLQFFADKCSGRNRLLEDSGAKVYSVSSFDERFDLFWRQLKERSNVFLSVRDKKSLSWHFSHALLRKDAWVLVAETASRMVGYAVFLRQDNCQIGLRRIRLADFQAIGEDKPALRNIIAHAVRRCRQEGIGVLEVFGFNPQKRETLKGLKPRERKLACRHFFYRAKDALLAKQLEDPALWDPCLFDSDASL